MSYIREKFTYLEGLAEGLKLSEESSEGKMIQGILELLDEITYVLDEMDSEIDEIDEFVEFIDDDLSALEDEVYEGYLPEEDYDFFDDFSEDEDLFCPACGGFIEIEGDVDEIICPDCDQLIEIYREETDEEEEELDVE